MMWGGAAAQTEPKAYLYGIRDTSLALSRFLDSLGNANPVNFVKATNAVVKEYTVVYVKLNGNGYTEVVTSKQISSGLKAALRSANPGDFIYINHVKAFYMGREMLFKGATHYRLL
jgi:hypothetical protein